MDVNHALEALAAREKAIAETVGPLAQRLYDVCCAHGIPLVLATMATGEQVRSIAVLDRGDPVCFYLAATILHPGSPHHADVMGVLGTFFDFRREGEVAADALAPPADGTLH